MTRKKQQSRQRKRTRPRRNRTWLNYGPIIGLVVVVLAGGLFLTRPNAHPSAAGAASAAVRANEPALDPATAPVTIIEYGDFVCPACQSRHQAGKEQVLVHFGDQLRFVWRDFPVITPMSHEAAECAHGQGHFWGHHDLLLECAPRIGVADLKTYATELGLETEQFDQCLDLDQHRPAVGQDYNAARALNLRGRPSFVVNGEVLPAPPSSGFLQQFIESKLDSR
jgi:protein-disulfide isomerase